MTTTTTNPTTTTTTTADITVNDLMLNIQNGLQSIASYRVEKQELNVREKNQLLNMEINFHNDIRNLAEINKAISNGGLQKHTLAIIEELKADYVEKTESKEYKVLSKFEFFIKSNIPYFLRSRVNKKNETVYHSFTGKNVALVMGYEKLIKAELKAELKAEVSAYYISSKGKSLKDIDAIATKPLIKAFNAVASDIDSKLKADAKKVFDKYLNIKADIKTSDIDAIINHLNNLKADALKKA